MRFMISEAKIAGRGTTHRNYYFLICLNFSVLLPLTLHITPLHSCSQLKTISGFGLSLFWNHFLRSRRNQSANQRLENCYCRWKQNWDNNCQVHAKLTPYLKVSWFKLEIVLADCISSFLNTKCPFNTVFSRRHKELTELAVVKFIPSC